jgi:hypothetical protein
VSGFRPGSREGETPRLSVAGSARSAISQLARSSNQPVEPTFHSRFEFKYLVPPARLPAIREFLGPFTRPDRFAALHAGNRYPICSLYLDAPDLRLFRQTRNGERNRFKLRVRTYSDDPARPAYLEVKHRANTAVHKRRAGMSRAQARRLLDRRSIDFEQVSPDSRADAEWFLAHMRLATAGPVLRVKYWREAYEANGNEPARITIDTELMHAVTLDGELSHAAGRFEATPLDGAIVEVKFTERYPGWVGDFVRAFDLRQQPVPKYGLSIEYLVQRGFAPERVWTARGA